MTFLVVPVWSQSVLASSLSGWREIWEGSVARAQSKRETLHSMRWISNYFLPYLQLEQKIFPKEVGRLELSFPTALGKSGLTQSGALGQTL